MIYIAQLVAPFQSSNPASKVFRLYQGPWQDMGETQISGCGDAMFRYAGSAKVLHLEGVNSPGDIQIFSNVELGDYRKFSNPTNIGSCSPAYGFLNGSVIYYATFEDQGEP